MSQRLCRTLFILLALTLALVSGQLIADVKSYSVSTAALQSGAEAPSGVADSNYATAFEPGEGFAPGYCAGQEGWTAFASSSNEGHIDTINPPDAGEQHLRISKDPAVGVLVNTGCFSPDLGPQTLAPSVMSIDIAIGATGGADYDVVPQAPSQLLLTARVKFSFLGDILILDDTGGGLAFQDSGVNWDVGEYRELRIEVDPGDDTIFYYYDGALIYSSVAGVFAGTAMEQIVLLSDNFHISESGDFDNLDVQNVVLDAPPDQARFFVTKDFDDDNESGVEVTLSCNTGLPLEQSTTIAEGDPVNFVVGDFEQGTLDCEITEDVPAGYVPDYNSPDNVGDPAESCDLQDLEGGQYLCNIVNSLQEVEIEVTKVWIDENPEFNAQNVAEAEWSCSNQAFGCIGTASAEGFPVCNGILDFFGNPATDSFEVFPDWEEGTECTITEVGIADGGVEIDDSECQSLTVFPGVPASCTIYNTRLYEGIPTLSQYGLGLLALLMLGVGFVAFRRVI